MKKLSVVITSVPDRKNLVAEIWLDDQMVAEINNENDHQEIILYSSEDVGVPMQEFLEALYEARQQLNDGKQNR